MKKDQLLIIFAKEPELGKVKTRLGRALGKEKALKIYLWLIKKMFKTFKTTDYEVKVYFTPRNKKLKALAPKRFKFKAQKGRDLGIRMLNAFQQNINLYGKVVLIGADCPFLNKRLINRSFRALDNYDVVLGPTEDGGYHLIGLTHIFPKIFTGIAWGKNSVLRQTLRKCKLLSIKPFLLKKTYDIDTIHDLKKWRKIDANSKP
jgi:rSAM/selenodomain-associated transferase 1